MDALSRILSTVNMTGSLYFPALFRASWGLAVPANTTVCRFHVVVEGSCLLTVGEEAVLLDRGDLALVPHGAKHLLQDESETPLVDLSQALEEKAYSGSGLFEWGEDGRACRLICGHFAFDQQAAHPMLDALPTLIHLQATPTYDFRWVDEVMRFMGEEMHSQKPGSELIAQRLSEILFVQVVRYYGETSASSVPILAALTDERLSRALFAMHTDLARDWHLEDLAAFAAMSRTAFVQTFTALVGSTPMKYLLGQRMAEAGRLLRAGARSAEVAGRVGYRSEAAFARKFKAFHGLGPGAYRKQ